MLDCIAIFCYRYQECGVLLRCLEELATRYPATKFVKIISTDCIPNYPDRNLPTLLVYSNGAVKANYVGLHSFGRRCTPEGSLQMILFMLLWLLCCFYWRCLAINNLSIFFPCAEMSLDLLKLTLHLDRVMQESLSAKLCEVHLQLYHDVKIKCCILTSLGL